MHVNDADGSTFISSTIVYGTVAIGHIFVYSIRVATHQCTEILTSLQMGMLIGQFRTIKLMLTGSRTTRKQIVTN